MSSDSMKARPLIGSGVVCNFGRLGWIVHSTDNNLPSSFFGPPRRQQRWHQPRLRSLKAIL